MQGFTATLSYSAAMTESEEKGPTRWRRRAFILPVTTYSDSSDKDLDQELKVPGESAYHMAGHIIPLDPRRLTLRLIKIKLRVIEFVFGIDC